MLRYFLVAALAATALTACDVAQTKNIAATPPWLHPLMVASSGLEASYRPSMPREQLLSCDDPKRLSSDSRDDQFLITYRNKSSEPVSIYSIDSKGGRVAIDDIGGHQYNIHPAKLSDTLLVADAGGDCIGIVQPGAHSQTIVIRYRENGGRELLEGFAWSRILPSDKASSIVQGFSLDSACAATGKVEYRIMEVASHGRVEIRTGEDFPRYGPEDPLATCNATKAPDTELWFWPNKGYSGKETMVIDVIYPDGKKEEIQMTFWIGVKAPQ